MRRLSLEIRLLGRLEVVRDARALDLPRSRKARALMAYLAATARGHGREHLCDLLWDGPADPRAALRGALSKLRPLLDDDRTTRLVTEGDRVSFEPNGALVDVAAVRAVASRLDDADLAALESAAAYFRGGFLESLGMRGCYRFDAWCTAERESVRRLRVSLLCALIDRLRDQPEKALRHARERLILDPCVEAANVEVIRLLSTLGRAQEALEQYETCRRVLKKELGVRPSAELEAMRRKIMPAYSATPARAPAPALSTESRPPLVGRRREREVLDEIIGAGMRGVEQLLLFVGEPGIGKTRLLEEVGMMAQVAGAEVLSGRSFEAELIRPYGAWIDALRSIPTGEIPAALHPELALLLPELGPAPSESADRGRLFEAVARLLNDRSNHERPVAIVLDDVQWLDEASAALLHFVARQLAGSRVLIACASRRAELDENPVAARLLRTFRREGALRQLELGPLDARDTADLVRRVDPERDAAR
ncbi:MAG: AAA family ATPase, partial [Longimicrobiales bacterium]